MEINQFKSTILAHKEGFLFSTGNQDGDCQLSVDVNSVFFDSVNMIGKCWLMFQNKLNTTEENGKTLSSIYAIGNASISLDHVKTIEEFTGDYLINQLPFQVSRLFTLQLKDETGNSTWLTIGLA